MKFKVGDKVRVREDLVEGNLYGTEYFIGLIEYYRGEVFEVTKVMETSYKLGEDGLLWTDEMLEEVNEKTFREVIADIKEGEVWGSAYVTIWVDSAGTHIKGISSNTCISNSIKFKLKRKEYTFAEAFKAYEEGKEVESNLYRYKRIDNKDTFFNETTKDWYMIPSLSIDLSEIRGKWYINH